MGYGGSVFVAARNTLMVEDRSKLTFFYIGRNCQRYYYVGTRGQEMVAARVPRSQLRGTLESVGIVGRKAGQREF